jgi:long-chain acyl-CoA synthetase
LTVEQVAQRAARAASGFHALGVAEGDAVALVLRNDIAYLEASLACQPLGVFAVPVNWHGKAEEMGYILRDAGAKAVVIHADLLPGIRDAIPPGVPVLTVPTPPEIARAYGLSAAACRLPPGATDWNAWLEANPPWGGAPRPLRATMIYTSGTTGQPKGVRRDPAGPEEQERSRRSAAEVWGIRPGMNALINGPIYHSAPNAYTLSTVQVGGTVVFQPRFDAEELLALIERHRITHMHIVPTMFVRLLKLPGAVRRLYDVSSLEWVIHGAAPCPPEVKRAMIAWWGPVIHEYYGSTEAGLVTGSTSAEWLARPGTVGRPTRLAAVKVLDDGGGELPPLAIGTVYMRQGALTDFTYHKADLKRREMERDGFITCGDMGYLDGDGYLFLCDRKIDMVISGGVNIYPAEIEAVLVNLPGVQDCAVFGIPDPEFGEALAAFVQPQPGAQLTANLVREHLGKHLADYKVPRLVEFHGDLPREDSGKIFKRRLREPFWKDAGRQI